MIHASPYSNYHQPDVVPLQNFVGPQPHDAFRVQYAGMVLVQDSKDSLGVLARFDNATWSAGRVVQMYLAAFYKANCADPAPGACVWSDFFAAGSSTVLRAGNVLQRLQTGVAPASGAVLEISSLHTWPLQAMKNSVGFEMHVLFLDKGPADIAPTASLQSVWDQLNALQCVARDCPFRYPAVFPARVDFGPE